MTQAKQIIKLVNEKETGQDDPFKHILTLAMNVMDESPFFKQILELEKKKQMDIDKSLNDVNYGLFYLIKKIDDVEKNFEIGIEQIQDGIRELNKKITPTKIITVREISTKDAKKEIFDYIIKNKNKRLFPSTISDKLGISYDLTLQIVQELINKKKIEIVK